MPSGTSPLAMRRARPSTIAVLPTPGSPIRTGLFLVRRARTWIVRRISSSRPMTGSSLPSRAACVRSRAYFLSASNPASALALSAVRPLRTASIAALRPVADTPAARERLAGGGRRGERDRHQDALDRDEAVLRLGRDRLGRIEDADGVVVPLQVLRARAADLGDLGEREVGRLRRRAGIAAGGADQVGCHALVVVEKRLQQVLGRDALVVLADCDRLCGLEEALGAVGEFLEVHGVSLPQDMVWPFSNTRGWRPLQRAGRAVLHRLARLRLARMTPASSSFAPARRGSGWRIFACFRPARGCEECEVRRSYA